MGRAARAWQTLNGTARRLKREMDGRKRDIVIELLERIFFSFVWKKIELTCCTQKSFEHSAFTR
jgi:hypothetical protein